MFTRRGRIISGVIGVLIVLIIIHHALVHDGIPYQEQDFQNAAWNIVKSHEGIIFFLLIGLVFVTLDDWNRSKKRK